MSIYRTIARSSRVDRRFLLLYLILLFFANHGRSQDSGSGLYYYCVERVSDGFVAGRGTTTELGLPQNGMILAPDSEYRFWMLQAETGLTGFVDFLTPSSGFAFRIPNLSLTRSRAPDFDKDGLADDAEYIAGTDPLKADTDGDGIADFAEMRQGLDPLDGLNVRTGVLGGTDTPGDAQDVFALNDVAVLADAGEGLTVFNIFNRMPPVVVGRIGIPGTALRVAMSGSRVAVAAGPGGLAIVDIGSPPDLRLMHRVPLVGSVISVAAEGGLAFAGTDSGELAVVDMESGAVQQRLRLLAPVQDLVLAGDAVYALTATELWTLASDYGEWQVRDRDAFGGGTPGGLRGFRLSIGEGLLYANSGTGVFVFDIAQPTDPVFRRRNDTTMGDWKQLISNGAGIGLAAVGPTAADGNQDDISLYDLGGEGLDLNLITIHPTPGTARALSIYNGLAYVADGPMGLQVLNYLAYDQGTTPPLIVLEPGFDPNDPVVEENKSFRLSATVLDDVQVRNVEFYLDGARWVTDGNFPFETRLRSPALTPTKSTFVVRARATDTGGNATWTSTITVRLVPDATPPRVGTLIPRSGGVVGATESLVVYFNEPLDPSTVVDGVIRLRGAGPDQVLGTEDDVSVNGTLSYRESLQAVFLTLADPLEAGGWEAWVSREIADRGGNRPLQDVSWRFWVLGDGDKDQDGIPDATELGFGYDPENPDSDGDGVIDGDEDADDDGLPNAWEIAFGFDPLEADGNSNGVADAEEDPDLDALTTRQEYLLGTHPLVADSDGDGWNDESELTAGSLPLDRLSIPYRWVGSAPGVRLSVGALGSTSGFGPGWVVARPPAFVLLPNYTSSDRAAAMAVARPRVAVSLSRALAGIDYQPGLSVARPPVSVVAGSFEPGWGEPGAGVVVARPPVAMVIPEAPPGLGLAPGSTVAQPPVRVLWEVP